jgi:hypothetical protein
MGGQRQACALIVLVCALLVGCATTPDAGIACEIPPEATLTPHPDGGLLVVWPDGTTVALAFANGTCVFDPMLVPIPRPELSGEELRYTYDYYRQDLAPCLDALGFRTLAPPTKAGFIASGGNWSPYDSVFTALLSAQDLATISRACPEQPPRH